MDPVPAETMKEGLPIVDGRPSFLFLLNRYPAVLKLLSKSRDDSRKPASGRGQKLEVSVPGRHDTGRVMIGFHFTQFR